MDIKIKKNIVDYYFKNPHDNNLKKLAKKFKTSEITVSTLISKELKKRFQNSLSRRCSSY
tara:strand:+ start:81 stop:260 length:180 start_codon:yes stop_codon:yes gene_type:complete